MSFAGPVDRVHFADEQQRYRRKSWRFTLFAALAVLTTGIPACIIATPLIYAVVLVIAYIITTSGLCCSVFSRMRWIRFGYTCSSY